MRKVFVKRYLGVGVWLTLIVLLCVIHTHYAHGIRRGIANTIVVEADRISYTSKGDTIAIGNVDVELIQYRIIADKILYKIAENTLLFEGNVIILERKSGNIHFVDSAQVNYKSDIARLINVRSRLSLDRMLLTADDVRLSSNVYELDHVFFSQCKQCYKRGDKKYGLWQLKAQRAVVDLNENCIAYHNVYVEFMGVPMLYTPYISLPSFNVKRKSGFLAPKILYNSKEGGMSLGSPYYIALAPNLDTIIVPYFSFKHPVFMSQEIRHLLGNGGYYFKYDITKDSDIKKYVGYLETIGKFNLGEIKGMPMELAFNVKRLVNKDSFFLKKYQISEDDIFISKVYLDSLAKNKFFLFEGISLQNLRLNNECSENFILPRTLFVRKHAVTLPKIFGSFFEEDSYVFLNGNFVNLQRRYNIPKSSLQFGYSVLNLSVGLDSIITSEYGHKMELQPALIARTLREDMDDTTLLVPTLGALLHWPLYRNSTSGVFVLDPIINTKFTTASNKLNNHLSLWDGEFDPFSVFNPGVRTDYYQKYEDVLDFIQYGVRGEWHMRDGSFEFLLAKNQYSGLNHLYVLYTAIQLGRSVVTNRSWFPSLYPFKFSHHELDASVDLTKVQLGLDYTFFNKNSGIIKNSAYNQEAGGDMWYKLNKSWMFGLGLRQRFGKLSNGDAGGRVLRMAGVRYTNDCLRVEFSAKKSYLKAKGLEPSTTFSVRVGIPVV